MPTKMAGLVPTLRRSHIPIPQNVLGSSTESFGVFEIITNPSPPLPNAFLLYKWQVAFFLSLQTAWNWEGGGERKGCLYPPGEVPACFVFIAVLFK